MDKPKVFLSHSSRDAAALNYLRTSLIKKTGGAIDFFLSSDGQSIPFGRNWVHEIEQALMSSKLMFVFLSPLSAQSNWIHFESGFAFAQGLRVIPVGCSGLDLTAINPPLQLLQGFNLNSEAGMNNILAVLNDELKHNHAESFTPLEFKSLMNSFVDGQGGQFSTHFALIEGVTSEIESKTEFNLPDLSDAFTQRDLGFYVDERILAGLGILLRRDSRTIYAGTDEEETLFTLHISAGFESLSKNLSVLFEVARLITSESFPELSLKVRFSKDIYIQTEVHLVTDKLLDSEVSLKTDRWASYRGLTFHASTETYFGGRTTVIGHSYIEVKGTEDVLTLDSINNLIALFFERNIMQERTF